MIVMMCRILIAYNVLRLSDAGISMNCQPTKAQEPVNEQMLIIFSFSPRSRKPIVIGRYSLYKNFKL